MSNTPKSSQSGPHPEEHLDPTEIDEEHGSDASPSVSASDGGGGDSGDGFAELGRTPSSRSIRSVTLVTTSFMGPAILAIYMLDRDLGRVLFATIIGILAVAANVLALQCMQNRGFSAAAMLLLEYAFLVGLLEFNIMTECDEYYKNDYWYGEHCKRHQIVPAMVLIFFVLEPVLLLAALRYFKTRMVTLRLQVSDSAGVLAEAPDPNFIEKMDKISRIVLWIIAILHKGLALAVMGLGSLFYFLAMTCRSFKKKPRGISNEEDSMPDPLAAERAVLRARAPTRQDASPVIADIPT